MKQTTFNRGHRWSDDEIKLLMRLWAEGKRPDEIADELGSTSSAISKMVVRLRNQGIPLERRRRGHQVGQRAGNRWTQEEIEYLARRRMDGATSEEIAGNLGRTHHAVDAMIAKLRQENVPIAMRGNGVRRLYDPQKLRDVLLASDDESVSIIRLDEKRAGLNSTGATDVETDL